MNNTLTAVTEALPTVISNTHFNVMLSGWPAAITVVALCCAGVAIFALKVTHPEDPIAESTSA